MSSIRIDSFVSLLVYAIRLIQSEISCSTSGIDCLYLTDRPSSYSMDEYLIEYLRVCVCVRVIDLCSFVLIRKRRRFLLLRNLVQRLHRLILSLIWQ